MESLHQQQLLQRLMTYVPLYWVQQALSGTRPPDPHGEWKQGAVLAAELHGLGALAEHANRLGHAGAEELGPLLNQGLAAVLEQALFPHGGQLVRLGGEQLLAFFLGEKALERAALAALAMHPALARSGPRLGGEPALTLRAAVAQGKLYLAQIGDPAERMEILVAGPAVADALAAQEEARWGEVAALQAQVPPGGAIGLGHARGPVAPVVMVDPAPPELPFPDLERELGQDTLAKINALRPFVPPEVFDRLLADPEAPGAPPQLRRATVLQAELWLVDPARQHANEHFNRRFLQTHRTVERHGGHLRRIDYTQRGRKITAVFGLPGSRGNDEERALGCALELRELLGSQRLRMAVNTGFVFSGEVGSVLKREHVFLGEAVQVGSRLLASADEGAIVAGPDTLRAAGASFELGPSWQVRIKGLQAPVQARTVLRRQDRIRQVVAPGKLAGRDAELGRALEALQAIKKAGGGALVVRSGQGAGKTRFLREVVAQAQAKGRLEVRRLRCSYLTRERPFALVESALQALSGDRRPMAEWIERMPDLLKGQLAAAGDLHELTGLAGYLALQKRLAADALVRLTTRPKTFLVLDDLHQADAESLEVFRELARRNAVPLLASSSVALGEGFPELVLPPLETQGIAELAKETLGDAPPALVHWLEQRSEGNVLQVKSLLTWLIDSDALEKGPSGLALRSSALDVAPAALRLPSAAGVYPVRASESDAQMGMHTDPGQPPPGADISVVLEARRKNRELAERIEAVPGATEERREELAALFSESDRPDKAISYALAAARAAAARNRFGLALSWTELAARAAMLADDPAVILAVRYEEAEAWHRLFDPLRAATIAREVLEDATSSHNTAYVRRAELLLAVALADTYARGAEVACMQAMQHAAPGSADEARLLVALARVLRGRGELLEAERVGARARACAEALELDELSVLVELERGLLDAERGAWPEAHAALERALSLARTPALERTRVLVLIDAGVIRAGCGDIHGAEQAYRDAERLAGELGLVVPRALALVNLSDLHRDAGSLESARLFAEGAVAEAKRAADPRTVIAAELAVALSMPPEVDALSLGVEALQRLEPLEDASLFIEAAARLARLALQRGERKWAEALFTAARARAAKKGIARHTQMLDLLGEALRSAPRPADA